MTAAAVLALAAVPTAGASPISDIASQLQLGSSGPPVTGGENGIYEMTVRYTGSHQFSRSFAIGERGSCVYAYLIDDDPLMFGPVTMKYEVSNRSRSCPPGIRFASGIQTFGLQGQKLWGGSYLVELFDDGNGHVSCAEPSEDFTPLKCAQDGNTITFSD